MIANSKTVNIRKKTVEIELGRNNKDSKFVFTYVELGSDICSFCLEVEDNVFVEDLDFESFTGLKVDEVSLVVCQWRREES